MDSAATLLAAVNFLVRDADGQLHLRTLAGAMRPCRLEPATSLDALAETAPPKTSPVRVICTDGLAHDMLLMRCVGESEGVLLDVGAVATIQAQLLENLVNQIAHDVRNHAFTIGLQAEMGVRRAAGHAELKQHFDAVLRQVDVLKDYLEKLLLFGRPVHLSPTQIDPLSFVREQVQRFQFSWEPSSPPLSLTVETTGEPGRVMWDCRAVGTALAALLDNAVRATPRIAPVVVKVVGAGEVVHLEVYDTGPGIPAETVRKLVTPMALRRAGGAGLGLAIARKMAQAHGGSITLDSSAAGTRARITLPREVSTA